MYMDEEKDIAENNIDRNSSATRAHRGAGLLVEARRLKDWNV